MSTLYQWVDLLSFLPPLILSFHPTMQLHRTFRVLWPAILIAAIPFLLFDSLYTYWGIWGFNPEYLTGLRLGNLPLEEVMFFFCIPYACIFSYHCINYWFPMPPGRSFQRPVTVALLVLCLVMLILYPGRYYTLYAFGGAFLLLSLAEFVFRVPWLGHFYRAYLVLQIPFLIVNGILTGTGPERPVVWYNGDHIIGWRIMTIPFEDIFYGLSMLLPAVWMFEAWRSKYLIKSRTPA